MMSTVLLHVPHFNVHVIVASFVYKLLCSDITTDEFLLCSVDGEEWGNKFTPRRWAEMEEAVRSRTEDMSKLQLIGEPLLSDDESDESNNAESEYMTIEQDEII